MTSELEERPLAGGNLSHVVRIGDTVRRPTGPWTPAVHALLRHLESRGFRQAPRALGIDELGREVLSFLPGRTAGPGRPWPEWIWTDETLAKTGRWLRAYHEAVSGFHEPHGARWRMNWEAQKRDQIICHFDVAPHNLVLLPSGEIALIDWDVTAPGSCNLELAKVANSFAPVHDVETRERLGFMPGVLNTAMRKLCIHRIRVLLDAYGLEDRRGFVAEMLAAADHTIQRIHRGAREGDSALERLIESGIVDHVVKTRELFTSYLESLQQGIEA